MAKKSSDALLKAIAKYDSANCVGVYLKLNKNTDAEIIQKLEKASKQNGGKQGYIKALILADIEDERRKT